MTIYSRNSNEKERNPEGSKNVGATQSQTVLPAQPQRQQRNMVTSQHIPPH